MQEGPGRNQGDLDAAAELMRKQGLAKRDKKATRVAAEAWSSWRSRRTAARPPWSRSTARRLRGPRAGLPWLCQGRSGQGAGHGPEPRLDAVLAAKRIAARRLRNGAGR